MANAALEFYHTPGVCSLAPHILLHEVKAQFKAVNLKVSIEHPFPDLMAHLNTKKRVPILIINGEVITENPAVMTAISQLAPSLRIFGSTEIQTVRVYEWLTYLSGQVHGQGYGMLWRPSRFSDDESMWPAVQAKGKATIQDCYQLIEGRLQGEHAVGSHFTAADAYLYVFWRWGNEIGIGMNKFPKFGALVAKLLSREAVRETLVAEGLNP